MMGHLVHTVLTGHSGEHSLTLGRSRLIPLGSYFASDPQLARAGVAMKCPSFWAPRGLRWLSVCVLISAQVMSSGLCYGRGACFRFPLSLSLCPTLPPCFCACALSKKKKSQLLDPFVGQLWELLYSFLEDWAPILHKGTHLTQALLTFLFPLSPKSMSFWGRTTSQLNVVHLNPCLGKWICFGGSQNETVPVTEKQDPHLNQWTYHRVLVLLLSNFQVNTQWINAFEGVPGSCSLNWWFYTISGILPWVLWDSIQPLHYHLTLLPNPLPPSYTHIIHCFALSHSRGVIWCPVTSICCWKSRLHIY